MNSSDREMNADAGRIVDILEQSTHANTEEERIKLAKQANDIHKRATKHSMKIDEHGFMETDSDEAKKCPALH